MNKNLARIVSTEKYHWINLNHLEDTLIKGKLRSKINLLEDSMENSERIIIMILSKKREKYNKKNQYLKRVNMYQKGKPCI